MVDVYYDKDADLKFLEGKTIGMVGYGSQGHAHALTSKTTAKMWLLDSTLRARAGPWRKPQACGWQMYPRWPKRLTS